MSMVGTSTPPTKTTLHTCARMRLIFFEEWSSGKNIYPIHDGKTYKINLQDYGIYNYGS
jgi:hypothetical protein